jgi:uncharacterized metal-binding protein YceD (DUF177 family)
MDNNFIIPLNGLAAGESRFSWHAGKEFFESFDNTEILAADLDIEVVAEKSGRYLGIDCEVDGKVVVECDRCLEDLDIPIGTDIMLSVKYGSEENSEEHQEGEREVLFIPQDEAELNLSQIIYDYVCLSLPMQRTHGPGGCNPDAMKYYSAPEGHDNFNEEGEMNPFAALKDMFR